MSWLPRVRALTGALTVCFLVATWAALGAGGASAASCGGPGTPAPTAGSGSNYLQGVAATSACDAWAVGRYYNGTAERTLVVHWNGKACKVIQSPNRGGTTNANQLYGVAATSATDAWALG